MAAKTYGNHGPLYRGGPQGVGKENVPDYSISWMSVTGKSGDVYYVTAGQATSGGTLEQGYSFQSDCGATVDFTLANAALALSPKPENQAQVKWANTITVAADGTILPSSLVFACARITFTGDGTVYIVAR